MRILFLISLIASHAFANIKFDEENTSFGNFKYATRYCSEHGMRLPTLREIAEWAVSRGGKGIKEAQFPNEPFFRAPGGPGDARAEYNKNYDARWWIVPKYAGDKCDYCVTADFYYNLEGFQIPKSWKNYGGGYEGAKEYAIWTTTPSGSLGGNATLDYVGGPGDGWSLDNSGALGDTANYRIMCVSDSPVANAAHNLDH